MKRLMALAIAATPLAVAIPGVLPGGDARLDAAQTPLAQVSQHLRAVDTMTASFTQTDRNGKSLTGELTLKRPGKIRFQYQKGVPLLVVGDGRALTMIDYQVRQVSRWPIKNSPLGVLLDPDRDLAGVARPLPSGDPDMVLIEAKDPKHPEYGTITIAFRKAAGAPGGLMLQGWTTLDAQNNRSTIRLADQRFNVPVEDRTFRWTDPRPRR